MDFRQIEAFCAVVEWGSFSEAAKQLYITQPTVSSHIRTLEEALNTRLIERTTKSLTITPEGRQFYEYAKSLLRLREKTLREFNKTTQDIIQFGASSIPSAYILPEILSAYHLKNENLIFEVVQSDSQEILDRILSGSLDMGITGSSITNEYCCCKPIYRDEMVLATPVTPYYLNLQQQGCSLRELLKEPYLMREDGSGTKKEADQFLETLGLDSTSLHVIARMNDLESIKQSIIYGLGISILSKKVTKDLERDNRVLIFPLAQGGIYRNYYLVYRKSKILNQQLWNFIQFVERYFIQ